jgi:hypothetical protein
MIEKVITFGPWLVFLISLYAVKISKIISLSNHKFFLPVFFVIWIFLIQGDSIILGPLSRLEMGDGEMMFQGYFPYLVKEKSALFLHDIAGGVDRFAFGRIGGALISGHLFLVNHLPLWFVTVFFRVFITSIAFLGMYFFLKSQFNSSKLLSIAASALFSSSFDFNTSLTFLYSLSIGGLPLMLYFFLNLNKSYKVWLMFFLYSIIFVIFTDPFYWLPSMWVLVLLMLTWCKPKNYLSLVIALFWVSIIWLINYSEAILAIFQNLPFSSRSETLRQGHFYNLLNWMLFPKLSYNRGGLAYLIPIAFSIYCFLKTKSYQTLIATSTVLFLGFASAFFSLIPWSMFGLDFLKSYSWYMEYYAFPLAIIVFTKAITDYEIYNKVNTVHKKYKVNILPVAFCFAISLGMLFDLKVHTILHMMTRGNSSTFDSIENLANNKWYSNNDTRVIAIPTGFDSNISSSYGLPSFDGASTFIPKSNLDMWRKLIIKNKEQTHFSQPGVPVLPDYITCCEPYKIGDDINFDMLRLVNVEFILSFKQLLSSELIKVSGPEKQIKKNVINRIFDKSDNVFVYKIMKTFDRIYSAREVLIIDKNKSNAFYIDQIKSYAPQKYAVFFNTNSLFEESIPIKISKINFKYKKIENGYKINILNPKDGILIINVPPLPWWVAKNQNDDLLLTHPVNLGQLAIIVTNQTNEIILKYERPTLFQ